MADTPEPPTGARLDLLRRLGFGDLEHDSHVPFLSHLLGTRRLLLAWGERPAMVDAGLFHSAYGTEYFPVESGASRDEVRAVIGEDAEAIAWAWCTIRRDTLELTSPPTVIDRTCDECIAITDALADDIATLWAADTVEQIARMAPGERSFAHGLLRVLHRASPSAQEAVAAVLPLIQER
ncbi:MAG: hypothetical protein U0P45_15090 [Acidimicrobiales bacterium]